MIRQLRTVRNAALAILITVLLTACGNEGPGDAFHEFMDRVYAGETTQAREYMANESIPLQGGEERALATLRQLSREIGAVLDYIEITEEEIQGELATLHVTFYYTDDSTEEDSYHMIKEDGQWKFFPPGLR